MDEKRYSLDGQDNWYFVFLFFISFIIKCHRCNYVNKCIRTLRHRRHSSGGGIMVWGMIMPNGLVTVQLLQGNQNSQNYIALFKDFFVPIMNINYPQ